MSRCSIAKCSDYRPSDSPKETRRVRIFRMQNWASDDHLKYDEVILGQMIAEIYFVRMGEIPMHLSIIRKANSPTGLSRK